MKKTDDRIEVIIMDLRTFNEEELFLTAIKAEVDANEIYSKLADGVKNAYLKDKLKFLAGEESKHREYLEITYKDRFPGTEVELPEKTIVPLPELKIPDERVPISQILESAMEAERAAQEFYNSFATRFEEQPDIKNTLEFFATMELGHFKILELEKENVERFEDYDDYWPMMHIGT
jgi:rubrerythrin